MKRGIEMNYAEIKNFDIANGLGVRVSLFVSGCTHHCKNCFNQMTWDFKYGKEFNQEVEDFNYRLFKTRTYNRIVFTWRRTNGTK